jgi:hypothetical protein
MGMELFGDCMDYRSFEFERAVVRAEIVRAGIFAKKIFSLVNSSKLKGKWIYLAVWRYFVQ